MKNRIRRLAAPCLGAALLLAACAAPGPRPDDVDARAQARWDRLLAGDIAGAYEYLSPGYRSGTTAMQYQREVLLKKVRWTGAEYIGSDCSESVCKVSISLDYAVMGALPGVPRYQSSRTITENWIWLDGQWWLVP
jgi:hypothetical protein